MANRKVTLQMYVKTEGGWRRYPAVIGKNGRIRPNFALVNGEPKHFAEGHYEIKSYIGGKTQQKNVGTDAQVAEQARDQEARMLSIRHDAKSIGVKILEEPDRLNLRKMADKFVSSAEGRGSYEAAEVYRYAVDEFLASTQAVWVDELTSDDIGRYQHGLRKRGLADRTISNRHAHVMSFFRSCRLDPKVLAPHKPKYEKKLPQIYSVSQMRDFFASLKKDYHRVVYGLALQCGLREQEIMHVKWTNLNTTDKVLEVRSALEWGFRVKDKEEREIPLPEDLLSLLDSYRKQNTKKILVCGTASDKPNTKLLRTLKRLVYNASLNCGACDGCKRKECGEWYLHRFRSTYITRLLRAGIDVRTIMRLSGHADLDTILKYMRPAQNIEVQDAVNAVVWK